MELIESLADPGLILFFSLPGFMLLKGCGYVAKNGYDHLMMSLFWGTIWFLLLGSTLLVLARFWGYNSMAEIGTESLYFFAFTSAIAAWPFGRIQKSRWDKTKMKITKLKKGG